MIWKTRVPDCRSPAQAAQFDEFLEGLFEPEDAPFDPPRGAAFGYAEGAAFGVVLGFEGEEGVEGVFLLLL